MVGLALLLGCDYDSRGIPGVGKELACKFVEEISVKSKDLLVHLRSFVNDQSSNVGKYEARIRKLVSSFTVAERQCFPNEEIIEEFLKFSQTEQLLLSEEKYLQIHWSRPSLRDSQVLNIFNFHSKMQKKTFL